VSALDSNEDGVKKRPRWQALVIWLIVVGVIVGGGVSVWRFLLSGPKQPRWITQKVTRGNVAQVVSATGTLQPLVLSPVGAQVSGIVWKIHADYNAQVKKGQLLVELDPALFQAAVRREEANSALAQAQLLKARADANNASLAANRARELAKMNYISQAERDTAAALEASTRAAVQGAEAGIKQAQAALDKARLDLKNSVIMSPVDGTVIARNVELGQAVVASFQAPNLFTIAENLQKMQVLANVDEADIGHVRQGAKADFTVDSFRGRRFSALVTQIRNAAQTVSNVVTYIVVLEVDNTDLLLRPGMTANVRLEVAKRENILLIPAAALRFKPSRDQIKGAGERGDGSRRGRRNREGGREGREGREGEARERPGKGPPGDTTTGDAATPATLYTPSGEQVEPQHVMIGISDGTVTEVREGLQEGQVIVTDAMKQSGAPPAMGGGGGGGRGGGGFRRGGL